MFDIGTQLKVEGINKKVTIYGVGIDINTRKVSKLNETDTFMVCNNDYKFLVVYDEDGESYEAMIDYNDVLEIVKDQCYDRPKFELLDKVKKGKTKGIVIFIEYYEEGFEYTILVEDGYGGFDKLIAYESEFKY